MSRKSSASSDMREYFLTNVADLLPGSFVGLINVSLGKQYTVVKKKQGKHS